MKTVKGADFAKLLEKRGWKLLRVNGSHHIYGKEGFVERISVPIHRNKPLKVGLLRHLMKIAGFEGKRFLKDCKTKGHRVAGLLLRPKLGHRS